MKRLGLVFVWGLVAVFLFGGIAAAKETVVVYTSLENEEVVEYLKLAEKELPDLDIQAIRLSTGELGARMLAGKGQPPDRLHLGLGRYEYVGICSQGYAGAV